MRRVCLIGIAPAEWPQSGVFTIGWSPFIEPGVQRQTRPVRTPAAGRPRVGGRLREGWHWGRGSVAAQLSRVGGVPVTGRAYACITDSASTTQAATSSRSPMTPMVPLGGNRFFTLKKLK